MWDVNSSLRRFDGLSPPVSGCPTLGTLIRPYRRIDVLLRVVWYLKGGHENNLRAMIFVTSIWIPRSLGTVDMSICLKVNLIYMLLIDI